MSKLLHVNINAKDWRLVAAFYEEVFGCIQIPPDNKISGNFAADLTGISGADIVGTTLAFPDDLGGAQLEIFQYNLQDHSSSQAINLTGIGHIAIAVENIDIVTEKLIQAGGAYVGKQICRTYPDRPDLLIHYVRDCEGNIIELMDKKANK